MPKKRRFKWTVEIEVDEIWVADGYEATAERVQEAILSYSLGYARDEEVKVKIIKAPSRKSIAAAQGGQE